MKNYRRLGMFNVNCLKKFGVRVLSTAFSIKMDLKDVKFMSGSLVCILGLGLDNSGPRFYESKSNLLVNTNLHFVDDAVTIVLFILQITSNTDFL